ncbi:DUF7224 domain-containing protein [Nocardioides sp. LML1-1-1.1]|uniref:DUF7224 domain-containing protein n=1 Tax=Nocardioides sp. LML1-1-1.1 TaxID=3135248 RepID=UPI00343A677C
MSRWRTWLGGDRVLGLQVVALLGAAAAYALGRTEWIGSWKQALDWGAGSTALVGPVAAGCACLAYARLRSSAMHEVLLQSRHDALRWLQPFAAVWALGCAAVLALTLTTTTLASLAGVPAYPQYVWIVVPAWLVLGCQTAIGAAIGWTSGRPWAAPAAAVLVFLLFLWTVVGPLPALFTTGGAGSLAGAVFRPVPAFGRGLLAVGLAWCVLALAQRRQAFASPSRVAVGAVAVVLLGVGWAETPDHSDGHYGRVATPAVTCAGDAPEVCVYREIPRPLADLRARTERLARPLLDIGVRLPHRFSQAAEVGSGDGSVFLWAEEESRTRVSDRSALQSLLSPAVCAADFADSPEPLPFEERHLIARWIQVRLGEVAPDPDDSDARWLAGDPAVQADWVRQTYARLSACDYAAIRMPDGVG